VRQLDIAALRDRGDRRLSEIECGKERPAGARRASLVLTADFLIVACVAAKVLE
jgi:hypothetical protein